MRRLRAILVWSFVSALGATSFAWLALSRGEPVNAAFKQAAAEGPLAGLIRYTEEELVSSDFIGDPASCILDAKTTNVIDGSLVTVQGWYDNEWGYASRCVDVLRFMGSRL